jgi:hypothetical protein
MALKPFRQTYQTNIECTVSGVAERGGILSFVPGVDGLCAFADATAVSGLNVAVAGLLMDDVEDINYFRNPEYRQRNVVPLGSVVGVATEGEFTIDFVETTTADGASVGTYATGDALFLADDGRVSRQQIANLRPSVGRALSALSADGFLKLRLEL